MSIKPLVIENGDIKRLPDGSGLDAGGWALPDTAGTPGEVLKAAADGNASWDTLTNLVPDPTANGHFLVSGAVGFYSWTDSPLLDGVLRIHRDGESVPTAHYGLGFQRFSGTGTLKVKLSNDVGTQGTLRLLGSMWDISSGSYSGAFEIILGGDFHSAYADCWSCTILGDCPAYTARYAYDPSSGDRFLLIGNVTTNWPSCDLLADAVGSITGDAILEKITDETGYTIIGEVDTAYFGPKATLCKGPHTSNQRLTSKGTTSEDVTGYRDVARVYLDGTYPGQTCRLLLPTGYNDTHLRIHVKGRGYDNPPWDLVVSGYCSTDWDSGSSTPKAYFTGSPPTRYVRFAYDTFYGRPCLLIGDTNTTWDHPSFSVDVEAAGSGHDSFAKSWYLDFISSEESISSEVVVEDWGNGRPRSSTLSLYVSDDGSDINSGLSETSAFASLQRALDYIALLDAPYPTVSVYLSGKFTFTEVLDFQVPHGCFVRFIGSNYVEDISATVDSVDSTFRTDGMASGFGYYKVTLDTTTPEVGDFVRFTSFTSGTNTDYLYGAHEVIEKESGTDYAVIKVVVPDTSYWEAVGAGAAGTFDLHKDVLYFPSSGIINWSSDEGQSRNTNCGRWEQLVLKGDGRSHNAFDISYSSLSLLCTVLSGWYTAVEAMFASNVFCDYCAISDSTKGCRFSYQTSCTISTLALSGCSNAIENNAGWIYSWSPTYMINIQYNGWYLSNQAAIKYAQGCVKGCGQYALNLTGWASATLGSGVSLENNADDFAPDAYIEDESGSLVIQGYVPASTVNLYVDADNGSDGNTGLSSSNALATIDKALEYIKRLRRPYPDVNVYLSGTFTLSATLDIDIPQGCSVQFIGNNHVEDISATVDSVDSTFRTDGMASGFGYYKVTLDTTTPEVGDFVRFTSFTSGTNTDYLYGAHEVIEKESGTDYAVIKVVVPDTTYWEAVGSGAEGTFDLIKDIINCPTTPVANASFKTLGKWRWLAFKGNLDDTAFVVYAGGFLKIEDCVFSRWGSVVNVVSGCDASLNRVSISYTRHPLRAHLETSIECYAVHSSGGYTFAMAYGGTLNLGAIQICNMYYHGVYATRAGTVIFGSGKVLGCRIWGVYAEGRAYIELNSSVDLDNNGTDTSPAVNTVGNYEGYIHT